MPTGLGHNPLYGPPCYPVVGVIVSRVMASLFRTGWSLFAIGLTIVIGFFVAGCGQEPVQVYRVEKTPEAPSARSPHGGMPHGHPEMSDPATRPSVKWSTPEGWVEQPASGMRVGSFFVMAGDKPQGFVSIVPLAGTGGGDFNNINLWRSQVGLEPVSEQEIKKSAEPVEMGGQPAWMYDLAGTAGEDQPVRILGAIQHRDGVVWFVKLTGDREYVATQKKVFTDFLKSITFGAPESKPVAAAAEPAAAPSTVTAAAMWTVPAGWKEAPPGRFLTAKFIIEPAEGGRAEVNVSSSPGDGGGLAANVNRWRGQLGLAPLNAEQLEQAARIVETRGGPATYVEMSGRDQRTNEPAAVAGLMLFRSDKAWFFKLMGDEKTVAAQKEVFVTFAREARY